MSMRTITTTISFRAAWRLGVPHLAGQGVRAVPNAGPNGAHDGSYNVYCRDELLRARMRDINGLKEPGGVPRRAEAEYPQSVKKRRAAGERFKKYLFLYRTRSRP